MPTDVESVIFLAWKLAILNIAWDNLDDLTKRRYLSAHFGLKYPSNDGINWDRLYRKNFSKIHTFRPAKKISTNFEWSVLLTWTGVSRIVGEFLESGPLPILSCGLYTSQWPVWRRASYLDLVRSVVLSWDFCCVSWNTDCCNVSFIVSLWWFINVFWFLCD